MREFLEKFEILALAEDIQESVWSAGARPRCSWDWWNCTIEPVLQQLLNDLSRRILHSGVKPPHSIQPWETRFVSSKNDDAIHDHSALASRTSYPDLIPREMDAAYRISGFNVAWEVAAT